MPLVSSALRLAEQDLFRLWIAETRKHFCRVQRTCVIFRLEVVKETLNLLIGQLRCLFRRSVIFWFDAKSFNQAGESLVKIGEVRIVVYRAEAQEWRISRIAKGGSSHRNHLAPVASRNSVLLEPTVICMSVREDDRQVVTRSDTVVDRVDDRLTN